MGFNKFTTYLKYKHSFLIVVLISIIYLTVFTYLSYVRYLSLMAPAFDLGVKIQSIFTAFYGTPYSNPNYVLSGVTQFRNFNAIHLSLINYVLTIPVHIMKGPVILFIIQWGGNCRCLLDFVPFVVGTWVE